MPTLERVKTSIGAISRQVDEQVAHFQRVKTEDPQGFEWLKAYLSLDQKIIGPWVNPGGLTVAAHHINRWERSGHLESKVAAEFTNAIAAAKQLAADYHNLQLRSIATP